MAVIFAKVKRTPITLNSKALGDSHRVARAYRAISYTLEAQAIYGPSESVL
jgi:hypothetical protein